MYVLQCTSTYSAHAHVHLPRALFSCIMIKAHQRDYGVLFFPISVLVTDLEMSEYYDQCRFYGGPNHYLDCTEATTRIVVTP